MSIQEQRQKQIQKVIEDVKNFKNRIKARSGQYEREEITIRVIDNYDSISTRETE